MTMRLISEGLARAMKGEDCPVELVNLVVARITPQVQKHFSEVARSLMTTGSAGKRKRHDKVVAKLQELCMHTDLFQRAAASLLEDQSETDAEAGADGDTTWLSSAHSALTKHLAKTLCQQTIDVLLRGEAVQADLEATDDKGQDAERVFDEALAAGLAPDQRDHILGKIRGDRAKLIRSTQHSKTRTPPPYAQHSHNTHANT